MKRILLMLAVAMAASSLSGCIIHDDRPYHHDGYRCDHDGDRCHDGWRR
ncbi:hypothetical protein KPL74_17265 [Bacillus sp. NP157]|nr:hypothetical protein KPL74_17265 [Bacillus sp. NP157]